MNSYIEALSILLRPATVLSNGRARLGEPRRQVSAIVGILREHLAPGARHEIRPSRNIPIRVDTSADDQRVPMGYIWIHIRGNRQFSARFRSVERR